MINPDERSAFRSLEEASFAEPRKKVLCYSDGWETVPVDEADDFLEKRDKEDHVCIKYLQNCGHWDDFKKWYFESYQIIEEDEKWL